MDLPAAERPQRRSQPPAARAQRDRPGARVVRHLPAAPYVLTEALELEHLDYEEFLASYESMTLALATHLRELATFREER